MISFWKHRSWSPAPAPVAAACALWLAAIPAPAQAGPEGYAFELPNLGGGTTSLVGYRGRPVVVDFWAVWCKSCRRVFPILNELRERFGEDQVGVVGISLDQKPPEYVAKWSRKAGLTYTLLHDPEGQTADRFGVEGLPTLFVFAPDGSLAYRKYGADTSEKDEIFALVEKLLTPALTETANSPGPTGGARRGQDAHSKEK